LNGVNTFARTIEAVERLVAGGMGGPRSARRRRASASVSPVALTGRGYTGRDNLPLPVTDFAKTIAEGYAVEGAAIDLGRGVHEGEVAAEAVVRLPLATMNRHGLIAGATGTGKTRTLQLIAEQLSEHGVPTTRATSRGCASPAPPTVPPPSACRSSASRTSRQGSRSSSSRSAGSGPARRFVRR
jgi:hypothetical protein